MEHSQDSAVVTIDDKAQNIYYRASGLGGCPRRLWAARSKFDAKPPPAALQKAFDKGHELEPMILALAEERLNTKFTWYQQETTLSLGVNAAGQNLWVVGHVDAVYRSPNLGGIPVDAKAFAQSTMNDFLANGIESFPHYAYQQSVYALGLNTTRFILPLYNKDTEELIIKQYDSLPVTREQITMKVLEIELAFENGSSSDDIPCDSSWGCPYSYLHDEKDDESLTSSDLETAIAYNRVSEKIKSLESAKSILGKRLLESLDYTDDLRKFTSPSVTVSVINNSKRFDQQRAKEYLTNAGEDIKTFYTPGTGQHITVSVNKAKGE